MSSDSTIWYRVGYALERARRRDSSPREGTNGRKPTRSRSGTDDRPDWPTADDLIASGAAALAGKLLSAWSPTRKVTFTRLLRAGLAGAGAALLVELMRPLLGGRAELPEVDGETGRRLLAGAGQGVLYGAVVEPRVPGPPLLKGAAFALAEYMAHPAGGLAHLLGGHTPLGRIPGIAGVLDELEPEDREYVEHLAFGVALALLHGSSPPLDGSDDVADD